MVFLRTTVCLCALPFFVWAQERLLEENFNSASAQGWQTFASGWQVSGGVYEGNNTAPDTRTESVWSGGYGWTDYSVTASIMQRGTYAPSDSQLIFRYQNAALYGACQLMRDQGITRLHLLDTTRGIVNAVPVAIAVGRWYRVRATVRGSTATCEILDIPGSFVSGSYIATTSGTIGLRNTHIPASFDDVEVVSGSLSPSVLQAFRIDVAQVFGGGSAQGTLELSAAAPTGGVTVQLSADKPGLLTIPPSVAIAAGGRSGSFPIRTVPVRAPEVVRITATLASASIAASVTLLPPQGGLLLSHNFSRGTDGWEVFQPGWSVLEDGYQSAYLPHVDSRYLRLESVWAGGYAWSNYSVSVDFNILASASPLDGRLLLRYQNDRDYLACRVRLDPGAAPALQLFDVRRGVLAAKPFPFLTGRLYTMRASVNGSQAGCSIDGLPEAALEAQYQGSANGTIGFLSEHVPVRFNNVIVTPSGEDTADAALQSVRLVPAEVRSGAQALMEITLNAAAPAGGLQVTLTSSDPSVVIPSSTSVPAGQNAVIVALRTLAIQQDRSVVISAKAGDRTETAALQLLTGPVRGILLREDFESGEISGWQTFVTGWQIAAGALRGTNTQPNVRSETIWRDGFTWTDYTLQADVSLRGTYAPAAAELIFRYQNPLSYAACRLMQDYSGIRLELLDAERGALRALNFNAVAGRYYRLQAAISGPVATCEIADQPGTQLTARYEGPTAGTVGFRNAHVEAWFDNLLVTGGPASQVPDLVVEDVLLPVPAVPAGGLFPLQFTVRNAGAAKSPATRTAVYLRKGGDAGIGTRIAEIPTASIAAGGSLKHNATLSVTPAFGPGGFLLTVAADDSGEAGQANTANDYSQAIPLVVSASATGSPDLVAENLMLSETTVAPGATLTASFLIINRGSGTAPPSTAGLRLNRSRVTTRAADPYLANIRIPELRAGQSYAAREVVRIPVETPPAGYYVWAIADDLYETAQSDEDNDFTVSTLIAVTAPPTPSIPLPGLTQLAATQRCGGNGGVLVDVTWMGVANATGYEIFRDSELRQRVASLSWTDSGLEPGRTYEYRIRAMLGNRAGELSTASPVRAAANCGLLRPVAPAPIFPGEAQSPGPAAAQRPVFAWQRVAGAERYKLQILEMTASAPRVLFETDGIAGTAAEFSYPQILPTNRLLAWSIQAVNAAGPSDRSLTLYFQTSSASDRPGSFQLKTGARCYRKRGVVQLTWTPAASADSYEVLRDSAVVQVGLRALTFQDSTVPPGEHVYEVRARNPVGVSSSNPDAIEAGFCEALPVLSLELASQAEQTARPGDALTFSLRATDTAGHPVSQADIEVSDGARGALVTVASGDDGGVFYSTTMPANLTEGIRLISFSASKPGFNDSESAVIRVTSIGGAAASEGAQIVAEEVTLLSGDSKDTVRGASVSYKPGERFSYRWILRNSGRVNWNSAYRIQFVSGTIPGSQTSVPIGQTVAPGQTFTFIWDGTAPNTPGRYRNDWQLTGPGGVQSIDGSATISLELTVLPPPLQLVDRTEILQQAQAPACLAQGQPFSAEWRVRNSGTTAWNGYRLRYSSGSNLHASGLREVVVPAAAAGQTVTLSVPMKVPVGYSATSSWRLSNTAGTLFGNDLTIQISPAPASPPQLTTSENYDFARATVEFRVTIRDSCGREIKTGTVDWEFSGPLLFNRGTLRYVDGAFAGGVTLARSIITSNYPFRYRWRDGSQSVAVDKTLLIDTRFAVKGLVTDQTSGQPLADVAVALAGRTFRTPANGQYEFTNLDRAQASTLTAQKSGYADIRTNLDSGSNTRAVTFDFKMARQQVASPVIQSVFPDIPAGSAILAGVLPFKNTDFRVRVLWNGTPGSLAFYLNGQLVVNSPGTLDPGGSGSGSGSLTLPRSTDRSGALVLKIVAINREGKASQPYERVITVVPNQIPGLLFTCEPGFSTQSCERSYEISVPFTKKTLPVVGAIGLDLKLYYSFEMTRPLGDFEVSFSLSADKLRSRRSPVLKIGQGEWETSLLVKGGGTVKPSGVQLDSVGVTVEFSGRQKVAEPSVLDLIGPLGRAAATIPGLKGFLSALKLNIYAVIQGLRLTGSYQFLNPTGLKLEGEGTVGPEAAYEPSLKSYGIDGRARFYVGGNIFTSLGVRRPYFYKGAGQIYAGAEIQAWLFTVSEKASWDVFSYIARGAQPLRKAAGSISFSPVSRDYLEAGLPHFSVYDNPKPGSREARSGIRTAEAFAAMGQRSTAERLGAVDLPLVENVFPDSDPAVAARGNELLLLYVNDNGSAGRLQFTDINWMRFDGVNWSAPEPIAQDTRAEFAPKVAFDAKGNAVAVWERVKDPNFDQVDLEAFGRNLEIVTARWDRSSNRWSEPVALTDNSVMDHAPQIAGPLDDGSMLIAWRRSGEAPFGSEGSYLWSRWDPNSGVWSAPSTLLANGVGAVPVALAAGGAVGIAAWSKDMDGNAETTEDQEIFYRKFETGQWGTETQLTHNGVADSAVRAVVGERGAVYLAWQRDKALVVDRELLNAPVVIRSDSQQIGLTAFAMTLGPSGNLAVLWQAPDGEGSRINYRVLDPASGQWSEDLVINSDSSVNRSFAPVWDSAGNLTLAYNRVSLRKVTKQAETEDGQMLTVENVPDPGRVDLQALKKALLRDMAIGEGDFRVQAEAFAPGQPVRLAAKVRNSGDLAVENVEVAFSAEGREIGRTPISGWLAAGAAAEAELEWIPPGGALPRAVTAVVDPDGRVTEFDETNNRQTAALTNYDSSVSLKTAEVFVDGSARIVARVVNLGPAAAPSGRIQMMAAGAVISEDVPSLQVGQEAEAAFSLPAGSVRQDTDLELRLTAEEDSVVENNVRFIRLEPIVDTSRVADPDISIQAGTYISPQRVRITCGTEGARITYTTNGEDPGEDDLAVPNGSTVLISKDAILTVKAFGAGLRPSRAVTREFRIVLGGN